MSELLRSLTKNERRSEWLISHLLIFGQKTSDSLGNPVRKFPSLVLWFSRLHIGIFINVFGSILFIGAANVCEIEVFTKQIT